MLSIANIDAEIANIVTHGTTRQDIATLADLYICRSAMQDRPPPEKIAAHGSEFAMCVNGKCFSEILPFLEELMDTLKVLQPRLYEAFIAKLR